MKSSTVRSLLIAPALAMALFISGCDKGPSGVYKAEGPIPATIEFKSGKAIFSLGGMSKESDYTVNGDKISTKDSDGSDITMTINSDGTLTGPHGIKFEKAK